MIVLPYVPGRLHPRTRAWARGHGAQLVDVAGADDAYFATLAGWWGTLPAGEPLAVVEHDIVPEAAGWFDMFECGCPWATQSYPTSVDGWPAEDLLGCARFSGQLRTEIPDLFDRIAAIDHGQTPATHWGALDVYVARELRCRGHRPHCHGQATHLRIPH